MDAPYHGMLLCAFYGLSTSARLAYTAFRPLRHDEICLQIYMWSRIASCFTRPNPWSEVAVALEEMAALMAVA